MDENLNSLLEFLQQNKAKDVAVFDVSPQGNDYDFVVLSNFSSPAENKAFSESLIRLAGFDDYPEGYNRGEWIIFPLENIILHTFIPLKREKYNLDKLYQSFKINLKQDKKSRGKK